MILAMKVEGNACFLEGLRTNCIRLGVLYSLVVYQVISLGFDMDKAAAEVEALEKEKVEKEAREEEKRRCS